MLLSTPRRQLTTKVSQSPIIQSGVCDDQESPESSDDESTGETISIHFMHDIALCFVCRMLSDYSRNGKGYDKILGGFYKRLREQNRKLEVSGIVSRILKQKGRSKMCLVLFDRVGVQHNIAPFKVNFQWLRQPWLVQCEPEP